MTAAKAERVAPDVPGFRLLALLGHGRRFDTWDAWDQTRDARCVLKLVRADRAEEPEVLGGWRREAQVATTIAHPHLVRGYDVVDRPPTARGIVLETLRGATLAALVEDGALAVGDVAELVSQVGSALAYLHRHDWVHCDVKPANVVVDHGRAVLIDLSLVQPPGPTRRGAGTPGFQAPEQLRGDRVDAATDVHGLALTALEALSGDEPPASRRRRSRLLADVPAPLGPALAAALQPRPGDRPPMADLLAAARRAGPAEH